MFLRLTVSGAYPLAESSGKKHSLALLTPSPAPLLSFWYILPQNSVVSATFTSNAFASIQPVRDQFLRFEKPVAQRKSGSCKKLAKR
jgi:hypothetical protein